MHLSKLSVFSCKCIPYSLSKVCQIAVVWWILHTTLENVPFKGFQPILWVLVPLTWILKVNSPSQLSALSPFRSIIWHISIRYWLDYEKVGIRTRTMQAFGGKDVKHYKLIQHAQRAQNAWNKLRNYLTGHSFLFF